MHARVTTFRSKPDIADGPLRPAIRQRIQSLWSDLPGIVGFIDLVDRETGEALTISIWEDRAALVASEEVARRHREGAAEDGAEQVVAVATYEVGLAFLNDAYATKLRPAHP